MSPHRHGPFLPWLIALSIHQQGIQLQGLQRPIQAIQGSDGGELWGGIAQLGFMKDSMLVACFK